MSINPDRIRTLSNGVRVANFSSPHHFEFIDGTELPRVSKSIVKALMLDVHEETVQQRNVRGTAVLDIKVTFKLTYDLKQELIKWAEMYAFNLVDIVIVPLPVMQCLKAEGYDILNMPFRCVRVASREDKTIYCDKFTL